MKKRIPIFLAGMLTAALVGTLAVGTLAATGALTIEVNPINVQVNGQTFQPKDAKGNDVPVFAYNGTTYAPLRALAEAYGLEVGYDKEKNMATVGEKGSTAPETPDTTNSGDYSDWTAEEEKAYQEFKGMWEFKDIVKMQDWHEYRAVYSGNLTKANVISKWEPKFAERMAKELIERGILDFYYTDATTADSIIGQASVFMDGRTSSGLY